MQVSFTPNSNGSFRVVIASPEWTGGNAATTASTLIGSDATTAASSLLATQSSWWNGYWANSGLIEANSSDGTAQYMENLRTLYLYDEAASMHAGDYPGSQAGVADMFAYDEDQQDWYPAGYWLWNLRGQIAANLSSGNFNLNLPIFSMYLNDLPAIESWTSAQMGGLTGRLRAGDDAVQRQRLLQRRHQLAERLLRHRVQPELQRRGHHLAAPSSRCGSGSSTRTPAASASCRRTTRSWSRRPSSCSPTRSVGSDGYLHAVANAHETQWAVHDPTTDLAADQALFPATVSAATLLNTDSSLVSQLKTAESEIEPYARTDAATHAAAAQPAADLRVRGRQRRRRRHRRDRGLLPALGDAATTARTSAWSRSGRRA